MKRVILSLSIVAFFLSGCYKDDIDDLKKEQERHAQLLQEYKTLLDALGAKKTITSVEPVADGWKITFSDNTTLELKHGKNGDDAPAIVEIEIVDGNVAFTFSDGETISIPMTQRFACSIVGAETAQYFLTGATRVFTITQSGVQNIAVVKPDGWRVALDGNTLTVTAPESVNTFAENNGVVTIIATDENNATAIASMEVHAVVNYVIDFENPHVFSFLAGPTVYGENLYDGYKSTGTFTRYIGYDDPIGLFMMINKTIPWGKDVEVHDFSGGGIAISQWNDMDDESFLNQCSVYAKNATTGFGGHNGSKTFAVVFGGFESNFPAISFNDGETECTFDHFYVTNSTYAALSMINGDFVAKKFSYDDEDWFKLVIDAYDKNGNSTGTSVEFYLADFRTPTSPGVITEWTKVDLTPLGNKVHTVKFDLQSSDVGDWGMNTPAYFCFDNLAVKK